MPNFQDTFETCKSSFTGASSICMTVPLIKTLILITQKHTRIYLKSYYENLKFDCDILKVIMKL